MSIKTPPKVEQNCHFFYPQAQRGGSQECFNCDSCKVLFFLQNDVVYRCSIEILMISQQTKITDSIGYIYI